MAISNLLTGRVRVVSPKNVTQDRYQFIDLSQVEPNLGVPNFSASLSGSPAIVVSDDQGNRGFVRSLDLDRVSGQFTGSFTGSADLTGSFRGDFSGDGSKLINLPISDTAQKLASASFTASFSSGGLDINTNTNIQGNLSVTDDVRIGGNLYVSKSIYADQLIVNVISSSIIYSSGSNKFGDESIDKQEFTGSVEIRDRVGANEITASSILSQFTGSFFGDGRDLKNVPAILLASGSVTASIVGDLIIFNAQSASFLGGVQITGSLLLNTGSVVIESGSIVAARGVINQLTASSIISQFTGSFFGDGRDIFNLPQATKLATGSVTASVSPQFGFKVESILRGSEFTGSVDVLGNISASMFSGSGRGLFDIPRSALTPDALTSTEISSGSVTASVAPEYGFRVLSIASGSHFSGSAYIDSSSFIYADGSRLRNIPRSALTEDALVTTEIKSGSVTASVAPNYGFKVLSIDSGSHFSGSVYIDSSSYLYSDGRYLRNIPRSALTEDALVSTEIKSGSVTASVSPEYGFIVTTPFSGSSFGSRFTGSVDVSGSVRAFSFIGDGSQLTNVASVVSPRIASGSVTASVSPNFGFVVFSPNSGSQFTGSLFVSGNIEIYTGSFSGSGKLLREIPVSAIPDLDLSKIGSGSVTASITPNKGFTVNIFSQFSGSMVVSSSVFEIPTASLDTVFDVRIIWYYKRI